MKKAFICVCLSVLVLVITGCESDTTTKKDLLDNTVWKNTTGGTIQIVNGKCEVFTNGQLSMIKTCEYKPNANGTGISVITICNLNDCWDDRFTSSDKKLKKNSSLIDSSSNNPYYFQGYISEN